MSSCKLPKIIHYCWFGDAQLPDFAERNISGWKKFFPGYELVEWNESNCDMQECEYVSGAFKAKKYAFVSDYFRYKVLHEYGGLYFDTDVEVIKSYDDIVEQGSFMGIKLCDKKTGIYVAPGLCMGAVPGLPFCEEMLENYRKTEFIRPDGSLNMKLIGMYTTEHLKKYGLEDKNEFQTVAGINIYPQDYFNPMNMETMKEYVLTENTRSIHHYQLSWK